MEEMARVKENLKKMDAEDGRAEAILRALNKLEEELGNEAQRKGCLKRKRKPKMGDVNSANIVDQERSNHIQWHLTDSEKAVPESPERKMIKRKVRRTREDGEQSSAKIIELRERKKEVHERNRQGYCWKGVRSALGWRLGDNEIAHHSPG
jgi:hypothetical protein